MQEAAITALGEIGGPEAKNYLEELLADPDERLQGAAREALTQLEFNAGPLSADSFGLDA